VTFSSTGAKQKPALDEGSFQQLLAAAYVVQQHNETVRKDETPRNQEQPTGTSRVLAIIAEIQSLIRTQGLNIADSTALIADRILGLTGASGVSISLVDNGYLDCVAEAGLPAKIPGSSVSSHSSVATDQLKCGRMFESAEAQTDTRLDREICREIEVGSLVAAPVLRFGEIAGLVEVRWAKPAAFGEPELRTCRLMAGLVTGTLERSVRIGNARSMTVPISPTQNEEEHLPIDEVRPAEIPAAAAAPVVEARAVVPEIPNPTEAKPELRACQTANPVPPSCRMCGRPFAADEQFCGFCSMPRPVGNHADELQSKWASLWFMQRAQGVLRDPPAPMPEVGNAEDEFRAESIPDLFPEAVLAPVEPVEPKPLMWPRRAPPEPITYFHADPAVEPVAPEITFPFEQRPQLSERTSRYAKRRWRELTLAVVAMVLAYGLILARPKPGQPTWFQSLMVRLGVQQKPAKVFAGTPDTRVWIDVHTQLYYCSGEDLYGKTPDGEFTTQYNAQSDGFLPASNTTCP
jgi:hypothetical protein